VTINSVRKLILFGLAFLLTAQTALAGLIRDAEIEHTLRAYANPVLQSAGIPPESVRILIVADPSINAFVAGGLNIFINTGLILETRDPGMLIGVIAHETGHISGAHLSQFTEKSNRALLGSVISAVIGAAAIAGGAGQAGAGIILGGQNMAMRNFLTDIRMNEQAADQAALKFLDDNEISASGMLAMFEELRRNDSGMRQKADPYLQTHPLTTDRISVIRNHTNESRIPKGQVPEGFDKMHARMIAKLVAFTSPKTTTFNLYPENQTDLPARYARAIAHYRAAEPDLAIAQMRALITEHPRDPFFYDTLGQILFENGKLVEASEAYRKAVQLLPDSALIQTDYGKTLIARDDPSLLSQAIAHLERARDIDDSNGFTWRQLAIAYGKRGDLGSSYAALAEESALEGDHKTVLQHVARARGLVEKNSATALALDDLEREARAQLKEKNKNSPF
jgi:predicted Zn-dependent protease